MKNLLSKQAKQFILDVCINNWQMTEQEIKNYCLFIVEQNLVMAKVNKDYLQTAVAFAQFAGLTAEQVTTLYVKGVKK